MEKSTDNTCIPRKFHMAIETRILLRRHVCLRLLRRGYVDQSFNEEDAESPMKSSRSKKDEDGTT